MVVFGKTTTPPPPTSTPSTTKAEEGSNGTGGDAERRKSSTSSKSSTWKDQRIRLRSIESDSHHSPPPLRPLHHRRSNPTNVNNISTSNNNVSNTTTNSHRPYAVPLTMRLTDSSSVNHSSSNTISSPLSNVLIRFAPVSRGLLQRSVPPQELSIEDEKTVGSGPYSPVLRATSQLSMETKYNNSCSTPRSNVPRPFPAVYRSPMVPVKEQPTGAYSPFLRVGGGATSHSNQQLPLTAIPHVVPATAFVPALLGNSRVGGSVSSAGDGTSVMPSGSHQHGGCHSVQHPLKTQDSTSFVELSVRSGDTGRRTLPSQPHSETPPNHHSTAKGDADSSAVNEDGNNAVQHHCDEVSGASGGTPVTLVGVEDEDQQHQQHTLSSFSSRRSSGKLAIRYASGMPLDRDAAGSLGTLSEEHHPPGAGSSAGSAGGVMGIRGIFPDNASGIYLSGLQTISRRHSRGSGLELDIPQPLSESEIVRGPFYATPTSAKVIAGVLQGQKPGSARERKYSLSMFDREASSSVSRLISGRSSLVTEEEYSHPALPGVINRRESKLHRGSISTGSAARLMRKAAGGGATKHSGRTASFSRLQLSLMGSQRVRTRVASLSANRLTDPDSEAKFDSSRGGMPSASLTDLISSDAPIQLHGNTSHANNNSNVMNDRATPGSFALDGSPHFKPSSTILTNNGGDTTSIEDALMLGRSGEDVAGMTPPTSVGLYESPQLVFIPKYEVAPALPPQSQSSPTKAEHFCCPPMGTVSRQYSLDPEEDLAVSDDGSCGGPDRKTAARLLLDPQQMMIVNPQDEVGRYMQKPSGDTGGGCDEDDDDEGACGCDAEFISKDYIGADCSAYHAHSLFKECVVCHRHPAGFLCLHCLKSFCSMHVPAHHSEDPNNCTLFMNLLDVMTGFDRIFWCERCRQFTWKYTEVFDALVDQIAYTRGTYFSAAVRDIHCMWYQTILGSPDGQLEDTVMCTDGEPPDAVSMQVSGSDSTLPCAGPTIAECNPPPPIRTIPSKSPPMPASVSSMPSTKSPGMLSSGSPTAGRRISFSRKSLQRASITHMYGLLQRSPSLQGPNAIDLPTNVRRRSGASACDEPKMALLPSPPRAVSDRGVKQRNSCVDDEDDVVGNDHPSSHSNQNPEQPNENSEQREGLADGSHVLGVGKAVSQLSAISASVQGWRTTQEDAEAVFLVGIPALQPAADTENGAVPLLELATMQMAVYCVFDGHGGDAVAKLAAQRFEKYLRQAIGRTRTDDIQARALLYVVEDETTYARQQKSPISTLNTSLMGSPRSTMQGNCIIHAHTNNGSGMELLDTVMTGDGGQERARMGESGGGGDVVVPMTADNLHQFADRSTSEKQSKTPNQAGKRVAHNPIHSWQDSLAGQEAPKESGSGGGVGSGSAGGDGSGGPGSQDGGKVGSVFLDTAPSNPGFTQSAMTHVTSAEVEFLRSYFASIMEDALLSLDKALEMSDEGQRGDFNTVGCTACVVGITRNFILCANVGDSGAAIYDGEQITSISMKHRVSQETEQSRILAAGYSIHEGRIEGLLAVPRALGDFDFKQCGGKSSRDQAVIAVPDVTIRPVPSRDGSKWGVILACDGIWDTLTLHQVHHALVYSDADPVASMAATEAVIRGYELSRDHERSKGMDYSSGAHYHMNIPLLSAAANIFAQSVAPEDNERGIGLDNCSLIIVQNVPQLFTSDLMEGMTPAK